MIAVVTLLAVLASQPAPEVRLINSLLEARTDRCLTLDRMSRKDVVSCAATGVGFYAYAVASKYGLIPRETASKWVRTGFDAMLAATPSKNCGWLYHFVDTSGKPALDSEVSSIDSVIFYAGAEKAARLLDDKALIQHVENAKGKIDLLLMTDVNGNFYHSFDWDGLRLIQSKWKWTSYNEGILIYKYFNKSFTPRHVQYDLPLFVYYYPLAFYEERSWIDHLGKAIDYQRRITGRFGYTASDSPTGYSVNSPYVVSPLAVTSCKRFFSKEVHKQLHSYAIDPLTPAMTINKEWISLDHILLDEGICLMLIYKENR